MKKGVISLVIIILLTLSAVAYLLYNLETYYKIAHNESAFVVCAYTIVVSLVTGVIYERNKHSFPAFKITYTVCAVILFTVFLLGRKIPFCTICDQTTAEDLGILRFWIEPNNP